MKGHIFSEKHKADGILKLGNNNLEIYNKSVDITKRVDAAGLLKNGTSQIRFEASGLNVEIRTYIANGSVLSVDVIPGWSLRDIQNVVYIKGNPW